MIRAVAACSHKAANNECFLQNPGPWLYVTGEVLKCDRTRRVRATTPFDSTIRAAALPHVFTWQLYSVFSLSNGRN